MRGKWLETCEWLFLSHGLSLIRGTYTFSVPNNVYDVEIEIWSAGGGGGGGSCGGAFGYGGSGGGGANGGDSSVNSVIIGYGGKGGGGGCRHLLLVPEVLGEQVTGGVNIAGQQGTAGGSGGTGGYSSSPDLAKGGDAGGSGDGRYPAASGGGRRWRVWQESIFCVTKHQFNCSRWRRRVFRRTGWRIPRVVLPGVRARMELPAETRGE